MLKRLAGTSPFTLMAKLLKSRPLPVSGNSTVFPNTPVTFMGEESAVTGAVGGIGCHTRQILEEHGYSGEEIQSLAENRIVRMPKT